jgi:hypothetical protein
LPLSGVDVRIATAANIIEIHVRFMGIQLPPV